MRERRDFLAFARERAIQDRLLARVGSAFALPIRPDDPSARRLRSEVEWMSMNGVRLRTVMPEQVDVLFFVREVTPLRAA